MIDIPTKVVAERLPYRRSAVAAVHGGVMLEAVSADDLQEFLEPLDLDDGFGSKGIERIVGELPVADISTNLSGNVVGADPSEGHRTCRVRPWSAPTVFCSPSIVPRIGAVPMRISGRKSFAQLPQ